MAEIIPIQKPAAVSGDITVPAGTSLTLTLKADTPDLGRYPNANIVYVKNGNEYAFGNLSNQTPLRILTAISANLTIRVRKDFSEIPFGVESDA